MIRLNSSLRKTLFAVSLPIITAGTVYAKGLKTDVFEKNNTEQTVDLKKGSKMPEFLSDAPNPQVMIAGKKQFAKIVVDLNENKLYRYDDTGRAYEVYSVASGRENSPTNPAIKQVQWVEKYPYASAHPHSHRRNDPDAFGPYIVILYKIDPATGTATLTDGEFLHGNNDFNSLGNYTSNGCVRVDNDAIKKFAKELKKGDIVWFKKD